ncbi:MAG: response regulator [Phycisphaerae bacterium]|nr:response regulator [Phycisphaerae bacterium]
MKPRTKVNILLVDDQPSKLLSLETVLAELGENVIQANSADEALKHLLSNDIAVVLVDVCMPKMDGFELAELIRAHPRFGRTAIIFISAVQLTDADRVRGYDLGAVDYIPVPIVPQVLRAKVAVFTDLYRSTRELERVNRDLEERVAELDTSNERLRFADRMATIGTLAAGLGHDMGNLLLPVRLRLDTLEAMALPVGAQDDVAAIRKAAEYLQRLARSLRLLALDPESTPNGTAEPTELAQWWRETEGMIRNGVPRHISLCAEIRDRLPAMRIDKAGLTQIVFNLVQNAGDALKNGTDGRVVVAAGHSPGADTVWLSVSDNGPGLSEEAKRRCFEPFFTTKTREFGTGLGLVLVVGLLKRAKGTLHIETSPGNGAVFKLEFPIAPRAHTGSDVRPSGRRGVAVVTLADQRMVAHVRSVLNLLEFDVRSEAPNGEGGSVDLWILEGGSHDWVNAANDFVNARPNRRAIVIGGDPSVPRDADRIVCLEQAIKPSNLRSRITSALSLQPSSTGRQVST